MLNPFDHVNGYKAVNEMDCKFDLIIGASMFAKEIALYSILCIV